MGFLWALFMPLLIVLSGVIVRIAVAQFGTADLDRSVIAGLALKGVPWGFVVGGIGFATSSLVANRTLITKVYFPREVLPLAALLAQGFDTAVASLGVLVLLAVLGVALSPALLWAPVLGVLLFLVTLTAGLVLSCANVFFRDVRYIVQVLLTFGIFFTPVFYEPEMLGVTGAWLVMINPVAPILEGLRLAVLDGHSLFASVSVDRPQGPVVVWRPAYLVYIVAWSTLGLALAARVFRSSVASFAEYA